MVIFQPKSKSFYRGKNAKLLMSKSGQACIVKGSVTYPANQTKSGKEETVTIITFYNTKLDFSVRPCDIQDSSVVDN